MNKDITPRQREILEFVRDYWREQGEGPSPYDIAQAFGVYRNSINGMLTILRDRGYIEHNDKPKRVKSAIYPCGYRDKIRRALR